MWSVASLEKDMGFPLMNLVNCLRKGEIWNAIWMIKNRSYFQWGEKEKVYDYMSIWRERYTIVMWKEKTRGTTDEIFIGVPEMSGIDWWEEAHWANGEKVWSI